VSLDLILLITRFRVFLVRIKTVDFEGDVHDLFD
jgi:hypothetical protein